ncbi:MAG TPA: murein L,D-transpeptidase catalytic domain family protein [Ferruginibacter sp.]|nr:murein L,D-transpeptidase catalytic domain family protein [Ferruginibacter sp.]
MGKLNLQKSYYVFFSALLILLNLSFVFPKATQVDEIKSLPVEMEASAIADPFMSSATTTKASFLTVYDSLHLDLMGLSKEAFDYAVKGFDYLVAKGRLANDRIISIADFSLPSSKKRLFVIDLNNYKVLFNTYVAHGRNSGAAMANNFSNAPESYKSSLGFYETLGTYNGSNGYSLRLEGLESGINDNANSRAIVIHGADYVSEGLIRTKGYLGRSFGCPSLPQHLNKPIIDKIKGGSCLFIYSQDKSYFSKSKILKSTTG